MKPLTASDVILIWFGASIVIHMLSGIVLEYWLRFHGVSMQWFWVGVPGYLERLYREWATRQGRSARLLLNLRAISVINVLASAAVAIPVIAAPHSHDFKYCKYGGASEIHECSRADGARSE